MRGNALDPAHFLTIASLPRLSFAVRRARTADVGRHPPPARYQLGIPDSALSKETVSLYQDVQEFWVVDDPTGDGVIGCGGLHVMWEDLAEVRTLATDAGGPVGAWGVRCCRNCCPWHTNEVSAACSALTFEVDFFARNGFEVLDGTPVEPEV